jgi:hypothetical protein
MWAAAHAEAVGGCRAVICLQVRIYQAGVSMLHAMPAMHMPVQAPCRRHARHDAVRKAESQNSVHIHKSNTC